MNSNKDNINLNNFNLELGLKRLQEVVKQLEENTSDLEGSLKLFEEGVSISRACHQKLNEAEQKIQILTKASANILEVEEFKIENESE